MRESPRQAHLFGEESQFLPELQTAGLGRVVYDAASVLCFPAGLPAFEQEREFLVIERPETAPVLFLQSVNTPGLSFITLPVFYVKPAYRLVLDAEDAALTELDSGVDLGARSDVGCLAIVTIAGAQAPTVNLMAPVVINWTRRLAVQAILSAAGYSHQHPLPLGRDGGVSC